METVTMVRNFSGSVTEYTRLVNCMREEKNMALKCEVLNTPSHMRVKKFGIDVIRSVGLEHTVQTRRVYA